MFRLPLGPEGAELRPLETWQADEFLAHMDRARETVGEQNGLPDVVRDLAESRAFLRTYAERQAADSGRLYGIWLDGTLVGGVLFRTFDPVHGVAEAGCWLEPAAVGQGLVTRACRTVIDWAFTVRGMRRVEWHVATDNAPSIAVARRLGMTREGVQRSAYVHRGRRLDMELWAVLSEEWHKPASS
ncbi:MULTISPECIES: GNAT family N-acetyltransferase [Streptomyces]|uniref:GNAT family N-acetyltransferase n=3 Tax=Streptomyces TaxID=1883 RepID=A0A7Y6F1R7_9ACTN|nr:GNAT family protein [Streptomyces odorifer]NUV29940.1 GNAT family N-acetyltransferase [Streptomyces odorifer]NUV34847.1 GNAT family N-acetyltransferase [Streptomyces sp. KAI-27]